ncbi:hypothetical protein [Tunturibacter empetritectus]|uniref:Uncharacterized protein n=1 Tax=Tunturiibacter empetritectus TaxID=3069691 RepID=A0A7W8MS19_9BACT|nr:hypothetical protein [Edaphobacter lichenicola]MBB5317907.1 hypothetical protein [Edaphobacter lichenicola]
MNEMETSRIETGEEMEPGGRMKSSSSIYSRPSADFNDRVGELEMENARLHRLVAELLIKNQQLRRSD